MTGAERAAQITELYDKVDWAALTDRLIRFAFVATRRTSTALAEDIAQTAITQVLDTHYADWNPDEEPDLFDHLANVARGIISNRRQRHDVRREVSTAPEDFGEMELTADDTVNRLEARDASRKAGALLSERFSGDAKVEALLGLLANDVTAVKEQAAAMKTSEDEVRNVRKRLFRATAEIETKLGLASNSNVAEVLDGD